jgi:hypothetical protein
MPEFRIQQKAIVWYETTIEADTPEQAIEQIRTGNNLELDWESQIDAVEFLETYWWENQDTEEQGEINEEDN